MIKAERASRRNRTRSLGVECLEGRAVLSGITHSAAVTAQSSAVAAAVTQEAALLPPTMIKSYLQLDGDKVTGLVMVFSKPLAPATAQDVNNYSVTDWIPGKGASAISSAVYNPSQYSVTLMLAQPFTLPPSARAADVFTVYGTEASTTKALSVGITDTSGQPIFTGAGGLELAVMSPKGPQPNPFFRTFDQSRINALVSRVTNAEAFAAAQDVAAHRQTHPLTGTIYGTYATHSSWGSAMPNLWVPVLYPSIDTKGAGLISQLGHVTDGVSGEAPYQQFQSRAFKSKQGVFRVSYDLQWASAHSFEGMYRVYGTGATAGLTGSGHVLITWTGSLSRGKFTEVYS